MDRRIFAPYLQRIEVEEDDRTALLQLPKCVEKQPGTGHQRQICLSFEKQGTSTNLLDVEEGADLDPA